MYRPLNNNETVVVNRVLYDERGLNEGTAASLFMIYKVTARELRHGHPDKLIPASGGAQFLTDMMLFCFRFKLMSR